MVQVTLRDLDDFQKFLPTGYEFYVAAARQDADDALDNILLHVEQQARSTASQVDHLSADGRNAILQAAGQIFDTLLRANAPLNTHKIFLRDIAVALDQHQQSGGTLPCQAIPAFFHCAKGDKGLLDARGYTADVWDALLHACRTERVVRRVKKETLSENIGPFVQSPYGTWHRTSGPPASLLNLPRSVQAAIVSYLSDSDLLTLGLTCSSLALLSAQEGIQRRADFKCGLVFSQRQQQYGWADAVQLSAPLIETHPIPLIIGFDVIALCLEAPRLQGMMLGLMGKIVSLELKLAQICGVEWLPRRIAFGSVPHDVIDHLPDRHTFTLYQSHHPAAACYVDPKLPSTATLNLSILMAHMVHVATNIPVSDARASYSRLAAIAKGRLEARPAHRRSELNRALLSTTRSNAATLDLMHTGTAQRASQQLLEQFSLFYIGQHPFQIRYIEERSAMVDETEHAEEAPSSTRRPTRQIHANSTVSNLASRRPEDLFEPVQALCRIRGFGEEDVKPNATRGVIFRLIFAAVHPHGLTKEKVMDEVERLFPWFAKHYGHWRGSMIQYMLSEKCFFFNTVTGLYHLRPQHDLRRARWDIHDFSQEPFAEPPVIRPILPHIMHIEDIRLVPRSVHVELLQPGAVRQSQLGWQIARSMARPYRSEPEPPSPNAPHESARPAMWVETDLMGQNGADLKIQKVTDAFVHVDFHGLDLSGKLQYARFEFSRSWFRRAGRDFDLSDEGTRAVRMRLRRGDQARSPLWQVRPTDSSPWLNLPFPIGKTLAQTTAALCPLAKPLEIGQFDGEADPDAWPPVPASLVRTPWTKVQGARKRKSGSYYRKKPSKSELAASHIISVIPQGSTEEHDVAKVRPGTSLTSATLEHYAGKEGVEDPFVSTYQIGDHVMAFHAHSQIGDTRHYRIRGLWLKTPNESGPFRIVMADLMGLDQYGQVNNADITRDVGKTRLWRELMQAMGHSDTDDALLSVSAADLLASIPKEPLPANHPSAKRTWQPTLKLLPRAPSARLAAQKASASVAPPPAEETCTPSESDEDGDADEDSDGRRSADGLIGHSDDEFILGFDQHARRQKRATRRYLARKRAAEQSGPSARQGEAGPSSQRRQPSPRRSDGSLLTEGSDHDQTHEPLPKKPRLDAEPTYQGKGKGRARD
ncbi:hypothetical protein OC861_001738 [Tilletia horrida]|nr:hypothetical protein OC861_001738 [Tilletia horrida]